MNNKIIFNTKEEYQTFITFWKTLANSKKATAMDHLYYALIQGIPLNKAFTPIKNKKKLECNCNGDKNYRIKRMIIFAYAPLAWSLYRDSFSESWGKILPENVKRTLEKLLEIYTVPKHKNVIANVENFIDGLYVLPILEEIRPGPTENAAVSQPTKKASIFKIFR